jgi:hypothetical protein
MTTEVKYDQGLYDEALRNPVAFIRKYQELLNQVGNAATAPSPALESVTPPPSRAEVVEVSRERTEVKVSRSEPAHRAEDIEFMHKVEMPKDYYPSPETVDYFALCERYREAKGRVIGLIRGDHGTGKTISVHAYASRLGLPLLRIDCSAIRDTEKWFGERSLENGETKFHPSSLMKALEAGNCVVLLDEITRVQDSSLLNPMMPLLDFSGATHIGPLGRDLKIGPKIAVFMTMNEGRGYTGVRDKADIALVDRTQFTLHTRYPTQEEEENIVSRATGLERGMASKLVRVANSVRADQAQGVAGARCWSVRMSLVAAEALMLGGGNALQYAAANYYPAAKAETAGVTREKVMSAIIGQFGKLENITPVGLKIEETAPVKRRRRTSGQVEAEAPKMVPQPDLSKASMEGVTP